MIVSPAFADKRFAVLGLARSGQASVEALLAGGAEVTVWDSREEPRAAYEGRCQIADPLALDLTGFAGIVVSPGVPLNRHPIAAHAASFGVPVIGDIELFAQARGDLPPHRVVGITGTNGKSTTTALIHHILKTAGIPTTMGGNIGLPILGQEALPAGGVYVLELSSYQIDLTHSLDCDVAVLLNITPDHLDRYENFEAYAASKARLFEMQSAKSCAVCRAEDWWFGRRAGERANGGFLEVYDDVFYQWQGVPNAIAISEQHRWPSLQGPHNLANAQAAIATCFVLDLTADQIRFGLETFKGLPHRMERVAEANGVLFVNDSKATNAASTAPALGAYPRIHWILGGLPKSDNLDECTPYFDHVVAAYTIGEAGPMFADILEPVMPVTRSEMMCDAVRQAMQAAQPGDVVMLSPACASFDQFRDFEARGDSFRQIVAALIEDANAPCLPEAGA